MNFELLPKIDSPRDLRGLTDPQLLQLADEIREALCNLVMSGRLILRATSAWSSCASRCTKSTTSRRTG